MFVSHNVTYQLFSIIWWFRHEGILSRLGDHVDHVDHIDNLDQLYHLDHPDHPDYPYHLDHLNHSDHQTTWTTWITWTTWTTWTTLTNRTTLTNGATLTNRTTLTTLTDQELSRRLLQNSHSLLGLFSCILWSGKFTIEGLMVLGGPFFLNKFPFRVQPLYLGKHVDFPFWILI